MSILKDENRKMQLDEIIGLINREEELKIMYDEDDPLHKHAESVLKGLRAYVDKLSEPEKTYVEMGLITHRPDKDEVYDSAGKRSLHDREKRARITTAGKVDSDEAWHRQG
jgi:predicted hydrolase (HD superfamily)